MVSNPFGLDALRHCRQALCAPHSDTRIREPCLSTKVPDYLQGRIKLFGAPRQWKISAPYFKQCFFRGGVITPQTESNTTPPSPKTEITNILFYTRILNLWRRIYCSGLRGPNTREKEIVIWPCWCFHGRYYFYSLKFTLMFIKERKRNANTYLNSNFDSLEAAPSNLPP